MQYLTTTGKPVHLVEISQVKQHEKVDLEHVVVLENAMAKTGLFTHPVSVDMRSLTLLDGHHRFNAVLALGLCRIPVVLIDYTSTDVSVQAWRCGETVTKSDVVRAGVSGDLMPIKTSRHTFDFEIGTCKFDLKDLA